MEIITCKNCGRLFNYLSGSRICPNCQKKMEEKFMEVKKYIRENPHADISTISTDMDVSVTQIKRWIREERLVFAPDSPIGIECEGCGTSIRTGRYCDKCKSQISSGLRDAAGLNEKPQEAPAPRRSERSKMRFLEK